jgi:uncharacterized damage-inducible protein DinB
MSTRDYFAKRLKQDIPGFLKVIRALPADRLDYRPHEKNTSAGALAQQLAIEMAGVADCLLTGDAAYSPSAEKLSTDQIAESFEKSANLVLERIATATDERWNGPARFIYNGTPVWTTTVEEMCWGFFLDLIHHRGQLTAYIRPMGGKVPGVYGPSADDAPPAV